MITLTNSDYTAKDYETFRTAMIAELSERFPEYTDLSQNDFGIVLLELFAKGLDVLSFYQDTMHNEAFLATAEQKENVFKWSSLQGYVPATCTPSHFEQVFKLSYKISSHTTLPKGLVLKVLDEEIYFELEEELIIPANCFGNETASDGTYLYSGKVVQGRTVPSEIIGVSNGSASQTYKLARNFATLSTLSLVTVDTGGTASWKLVDNFLNSKPTDSHFMVKRGINGESYIVFGDGSTGRIPPEDCEIYASYRICSGTKGNVAPNTIRVVVDSMYLIGDTFNPSTPIVEGIDDESLASIKVNAPAHARTLWRPVTYADYTDLITLNFSSVIYASAIEDSQNKDRAVISILTDRKQPVSSVISQINAFLEKRRIIGTDFIVYDYQAKVVNIEATLLVKDTYSQTAIKNAVETYLTGYFELGKIKFGEEISTSALSAQVIVNVEGVKGFSITVPENPTVASAMNELFTLGTLSITASGGVTWY